MKGIDMRQRLFACLFGIAALLGLAACATTPTTLDAQWVNPQFAGQHAVKSVFVMAAARDASVRRTFEDRMAAALGATGVRAVQSYKFIPEDGAVSEQRLRDAVAEAKVTHAMVTRILNVSTQVNVTPGMVMGPAWGPGWGPGGWGHGWGPGWGGFAGYHNSMWVTSIPPQVSTTQLVHADTRLMSAGDAAVLWSAATTTTTGYSSVQRLIDQFVQLIVSTLQQDGMI